VNYYSGGYITVDTTSTSATTIGVDWGTGSSTNYYTVPIQWGTANIPFPAPITAWPVDDGADLVAPARRSAPLDFNKYINASDLLEEFIAFLGENKVRQGEVMRLPLELFVKWLIIRACEQDHEEPNVTLSLPPARRQPRCIACGRFMRAGAAIHLHDEACAHRHFARSSLPRPRFDA